METVRASMRAKVEALKDDKWMYEDEDPRTEFQRYFNRPTRWE